MLELIRKKVYDELHICGLDEYGCVTSTSIGAAKRGFNVSIVSRGTATVFPDNKVKKVQDKLDKRGIKRV